MSKVQMVRALVTQRLTAAVEEIFGLFERTIGEYEEELCRSKEKNERQQKLLDAVLKPEVRLHRADIQQLLVVKEEVPPEQQEWSPSLDQEDPAEPPHIKEEQEELWTSQEGEQLQGLEEADITKFLFTPVPVKSEDDGEKPQSSMLHQRQTEQMETGADGEDCGGPEPARNSHPDLHLQPETEYSEDWNYTTEHESSVHLGKKPFGYSKCGSIQAESHKCVGPQSSQLHQQDKTEDPSDTEHSEDWSEDIREPPSDSKSLKNNEVSKIGARCYTEENPLSCSFFGKAFTSKRNLRQHMVVHTGEKRFSCSVCEKGFKWKRDIKVHMAVHTGERPFQCSVCGKRFTQKGCLKRHMAVHTGEKRFSCSVCEKRFNRKEYLTLHMAIHTGQKPFKCSVCGKGFVEKRTLTQHMTVHTGEKQFSCSVCDQRFTWYSQLRKHKRVCPQSSQLQPTEQNREADPGASSSTEQMETGADGEDCGGPEPARNSHPDL